MGNLLEIKNLTIQYAPKYQSPKTIIRGIDLEIPKGTVVGVVGESGSGKSMTMKGLMNILPAGSQVSWDSFQFDGSKVTEKESLQEMSMIFQDPMTSLDPLRTIFYHLNEVIQRKQKMPKSVAKQLAKEELEKVGILMPEKRLQQYPHELSGGMRQRIMIAMALLSTPKLLIADEPTTALDVTIQAQILQLIKDLQREEELTVVLVTHDVSVVASMCQYVKVMYQGKIVEEGTVEEIFYTPTHPYTKQLLQAANREKQGDALFTIQNRINLPDQLLRKDLSETHRVWLGGEEK